MNDFKAILVIFFPLIIGLSVNIITYNKKIFMIHPSWSPPQYLFPIIWCFLYLALGVSTYLAINNNTQKYQVYSIIALYLIQILVENIILLYNYGYRNVFTHRQVYILLLLVIIVLIRMIRLAHGGHNKSVLLSSFEALWAAISVSLVAYQIGVEEYSKVLLN